VAFVVSISARSNSPGLAVNAHRKKPIKFPLSLEGGASISDGQGPSEEEENKLPVFP